MLHSSSLTKIARIEPICAPITLKRAATKDDHAIYDEQTNGINSILV